MTRLLPFLLLCAAAPVTAQDVADYYHAAARHYIEQENPEAEAAAEAGLALDPENEKLRALLDKIRERDEGDSGEQQPGDADEQEPGEGEPQPGEGEPQPDGEGEAEGETGEQPPEAEQQPDEGEPQPGDGTEPPDDPQGGGGTPTPLEVEPGEMSRAEAERILRAIQTDELELLRDVQRRRARPRYVEKDW